MGVPTSMYREMVLLLSLLVIIHMLFLSPYLWKEKLSYQDSGVRVFGSNRTGEMKEMLSLQVNNSQEKAQQAMKKHIESSCQKLGLGMNLTQLSKDMLLRLRSKIIVNDKHKLLYCQVAKAASTTWRRILIALTDNLNITNPMTISANDAHHKYGKYLPYLRDLPQDQIIYRIQNYYKFVFVREPFERLLSAFRNKFEVNITASSYFMKRFGRKIIKRYRRYSPTVNSSTNIKFEEFVGYLIDAKRSIQMNEHWQTFTDLCHPCTISYDFIGKLETFGTDAQYILKKNSVSEKVKIPTRNESRYENYETNSFLAKYYSILPRDMLRQLYTTYLSDFTIFQYSVPDIIKHLM